MQNNSFQGCLVNVEHVVTAKQVALADKQMPLAVRFAIQDTPAQTKFGQFKATDHCNNESTKGADASVHWQYSNILHVCNTC